MTMRSTSSSRAVRQMSSRGGEWGDDALHAVARHAGGESLEVGVGVADEEVLEAAVHELDDFARHVRGDADGAEQHEGGAGEVGKARGGDDEPIALTRWSLAPSLPASSHA